LIGLLYGPLRRFAAAVGPTDVEPEDLVQEALFRALRRRPLRAYENLEGYLRQTILNLSRNHRRSLARRGRALLRMVASVEAPPPPSYPSDLAELLRLPAEVRAVLYLADVEGYSFPEIAAALRCSPAVARARASRGRRRLRSELGMEV
jgi:RNA polymerase sigma-70 factor (ECF subfamily)